MALVVFAPQWPFTGRKRQSSHLGFSLKSHGLLVGSEDSPSGRSDSRRSISSRLRTMTGATFVLGAPAREHANKATNPSTTTTMARTTGSRALTPYNSFDITWRSAIAAQRPMVSPILTSGSPSRSINLTTPPVVLPNATSMPISRRHCHEIATQCRRRIEEDFIPTTRMHRR